MKIAAIFMRNIFTVSKDEYNKLLDKMVDGTMTCEEKQLLLVETKRDNLFTACDNLGGDMLTESFPTLSEAITWLLSVDEAAEQIKDKIIRR